jgi:hypothetical protein
MAAVASPKLEPPPLYVTNAATMLVMKATLLNRNSKKWEIIKMIPSKITNVRKK